MVTVLKHRLALAVLVGVLVIPIVSVNNGGLAHLLLCEAVVAQDFAISGADDGGATVTSSVTLEREPEGDDAAADGDAGDDGETQVVEVCEGVTVEVSATPEGDGRVSLTVRIVNASDQPWRGSVGLAARGNDVQADLTTSLGRVGPGDSESATIELRVPEGQADIKGTLLLGP